MNCANQIISKINGVLIRELEKNTDTRGWLIELFRKDEIDPDIMPVMAYISMTRPGVIRGPHEHKEQNDFICFFGPSVFKIQLWDNRENSPTNGKSQIIEAGEKNPLALSIPPGVVHAYKNVGVRDGLVFNAPNRLYAGEGKKEEVDEIRYEDKKDARFKISF
ncbi:MAG: dTDP-4-dehydrorhamnose 3,5-epimerase [candidate division Zixibacteria bacterium]|nr:dTDP-4-dehydrorhamnose 3,5-epimerase [candidate division Zixibacteria bacterium]NIR64979.1 dTDP-4-dehydrorhamnose 3,5-epimerase [candidate division Zixibacteria bacterium]NIS18024.1 dTDP-4-dehydrorhamnose 3,5-epimerase [candidate division Zixibacteria bacterium]NIS48804.1 dTDP-4-dehydrorhamnose 3,5-epimerase [candidate division Zixibacteria bacterium]NIT54304.1 dTDP-4-dehydrorhamnose 3,5-epimerase [candidate division Zixibacteria bacterium]